MRSGTLNRTISIEMQTTVQDAAGQQNAVWSDFLTAWASIRAATSKEVYAASGFTSELTHVITIRYPSVTIRSNMRVLYEGRVFLIQAVADPDEGRKQLNLLCEELNEGQ